MHVTNPQIWAEPRSPASATPASSRLRGHEPNGSTPSRLGVSERWCVCFSAGTIHTPYMYYSCPSELHNSTQAYNELLPFCSHKLKNSQATIDWSISLALSLALSVA